MFRKRDSESLDGESGTDKPVETKSAQDAKSESAAKPEPSPEPAAKVAAKSAPAPPAKKPSPRAETPSKPLAASPAAPKTPPRNLDLPESEPLSAAPKSAAASVSPTASSDPQANKRLIVGQGIRLSGEINSCDRLVVEGEVEVTLNDTLALEITSSGRFTGGCEVEEADISGIYEGDLTVRNTLFVRGTGRITGTIRYGQLELERGGQIAGNISVLGNDNIAAAGGGDKVRAAKGPLFGAGND